METMAPTRLTTTGTVIRSGWPVRLGILALLVCAPAWAQEPAATEDEPVRDRLVFADLRVMEVEIISEDADYVVASLIGGFGTIAWPKNRIREISYDLSRRASKLRPDDADGHRRLADLALSQGDADLALELLKKLLARRLPRQLWDRPKQGFGAPTDHWLRDELRQMASDLLSEARIRRRGFFNPAAVQRLLQEHLEALVNGLFFFSFLKKRRRVMPKTRTKSGHTGSLPLSHQ